LLTIPKFHIEKEGERHVLKLTLPDWEGEHEILSHLARRLSVTTVGGIVEALKTKPGLTAWPSRCRTSRYKGLKFNQLVSRRRAVEKMGQKILGLDEAIVLANLTR